ncbi:MAG: pectin acetylesterase-family hydrolase [Polyangiaceae bacterium]
MLSSLCLTACDGGAETIGTGGNGGDGGASTGGSGGAGADGGNGGATGTTTETSTGTSTEEVAPIDTPKEQWAWVPFDDAFCANGTPTGIGANLSDQSKTVVIYMMGGGACWDNLTCYIAKTAVNIESGYGETQFAKDAPNLNGSIFNRKDPDNPLKDASYFFVPYCTGDVHAGNNPDAVYNNKPTKHVGFANMELFLKRIQATFPKADRVILSGSSAGGFGAGLNWWQAQQRFGDVRVDLVDDSGPPLPPPYLSESLEGQWRAAWNLNATLPEGCTGCENDLSAIFGFYAQELPNNRAALLSYTHDQVISNYFLISQDKVAEGLGVLAAELDGYENTRYFYVDGNSHVLLGNPAGISQNGVVLRDWLTQMITDDAGWANVKP